MEVKKLKAICVKDCFDSGGYDRERLKSSGLNFDEKDGKLSKMYSHNMECSIDPHNPIAVHFRFAQNPGVDHDGFKIFMVPLPINPEDPTSATEDTWQYKQINPGPTQAELDKQLAQARADNQRLSSEAELAKLREENEKLKMIAKAENPKLQKASA